VARFAWLCSHEGYQPEDLIEQAVLAEEVGFDLIAASDHLHPWVDDKSAAGFVWSWFGAVAARTERVALATSVTCPLFHYHPAMVAQAAATVSRLLGGREFILGVGTGENINEGPLGYEFPSYGERIRRMAEALEIIRRLFEGEKLDFPGKYYTTRKLKLYSPPLRPIPVWMAAGGEQSASFAGRHAAGLITSVKDPDETMTKIIGPFREAHGRPGMVMATRWTVLAGNDSEAWEALGPMRGLRAPGRLEECDPAVLRARADAMGRDEILGRYTVVSDAAGLLKAYLPLVEEVEADVICIQVASCDPIAALRLLGSEVLPELRRAVKAG
jgi:coenzyme F420-dependent glucose-6-phosphate dehydrogenase